MGEKKNPKQVRPMQVYDKYQFIFSNDGAGCRKMRYDEFAVVKCGGGHGRNFN